MKHYEYKLDAATTNHAISTSEIMAARERMAALTAAIARENLTEAMMEESGAMYTMFGILASKASTESVETLSSATLAPVTVEPATVESATPARLKSRLEVKILPGEVEDGRLESFAKTIVQGLVATSETKAVAILADPVAFESVVEELEAPAPDLSVRTRVIKKHSFPDKVAFPKIHYQVKARLLKGIAEISVDDAELEIVAKTMIMPSLNIARRAKMIAVKEARAVSAKAMMLRESAAAAYKEAAAAPLLDDDVKSEIEAFAVKTGKMAKIAELVAEEKKLDSIAVEKMLDDLPALAIAKKSTILKSVASAMVRLHSDIDDSGKWKLLERLIETSPVKQIVENVIMAKVALAAAEAASAAAQAE